MTHLHTAPDNTLTFDSISHFLSSISSEVGLSQEVVEMLHEQFEGLRVVFGDKIPREDALKIISYQIEITKTGKIREPVDIVEFIESPEYMGQGAYVRPIIMDHLIELHDPEKYYYEAVLGGAIGIGKNYFADMSLAYDLYKLSCLYSPQSHFELAPGSKIVFIHQSKTEKLAKKVVFDQFANRLEASGYFPKYFRHDPRFRSSMQFPHNIELLPISSTDTSALGMNVFAGVLDELNFMTNIKKSTRAQKFGEEGYDQAEVLHRTILRRMESRFDRLGKLPGKIYLVSSANYEGDFIDRKEKEAVDNHHIFILHLAQWESFMNRDGTLMPKKYCGKFFFVRKPTDTGAGGVFDERPEALSEEDETNIIAVPVEHRNAFEKDLIGSLRDIAGVAVTRSSRFLGEAYIKNAFDKYEAIYGREQIFKEQTVELVNDMDITHIVNIEFLRRLFPYGPFAVHIDLAISGDAAGIAIGHVIGSKEVSVRLAYDSATGRFTRESKGSLPIYAAPGLLQVVPGVGTEIPIDVIRQLVSFICEFIPVYWLTMDRFQSASTLQYFRSRDITSSILSVDRDPAPYMETKFAIKEERYYIASHEVIVEELPLLEQDNTTGRIDHSTDASKDLSDALAAVLFSLSTKRTSHRVKGAPKMLPLTYPIKKTKRSGRRPSSGRAPLY